MADFARRHTNEGIGQVRYACRRAIQQAAKENTVEEDQAGNGAPASADLQDQLQGEDPVGLPADDWEIVADGTSLEPPVWVTKPKRGRYERYALSESDTWDSDEHEWRESPRKQMGRQSLSWSATGDTHPNWRQLRLRPKLHKPLRPRGPTILMIHRTPRRTIAPRRDPTNDIWSVATARTSVPIKQNLRPWNNGKRRQ